MPRGDHCTSLEKKLASELSKCRPSSISLFRYVNEIDKSCLTNLWGPYKNYSLSIIFGMLQISKYQLVLNSLKFCSLLEMTIVCTKWSVLMVKTNPKSQNWLIWLNLDPLVRSLKSLLMDLTKPHTKFKSGDLSIMHDNNVMPRRKLSSDWLSTHVNEQGFC